MPCCAAAGLAVGAAVGPLPSSSWLPAEQQPPPPISTAEGDSLLITDRIAGGTTAEIGR